MQVLLVVVMEQVEQVLQELVGELGLRVLLVQFLGQHLLQVRLMEIHEQHDRLQSQMEC